MKIKVSVSRSRLLRADTMGDYRSESWAGYGGGKIPEFRLVFYVEDEELRAELRDAKSDAVLDEASGEDALAYFHDVLKAYRIPIETGE
ncbi:MAG: hypothetical protein QXD44_08585 [Candidatus Nezhaarchaeales archaeon]